MVNLWPNLTAYQSVSFLLSPFVRLFILPSATFRCDKKKLPEEHVNLSVLSRMEEADFLWLQSILCDNYANVRGLPCCLGNFRHFDYSKFHGNIRNTSGSNLTIVRNLTTSVNLVNVSKSLKCFGLPSCNNYVMGIDGAEMGTSF